MQFLFFEREGFILTSNALAVLQTLFQSGWYLFTSVDIPGTAVSPAELAVFVLFAVLGIRVIKGLFGGTGSKSSGGGSK